MKNLNDYCLSVSTLERILLYELSGNFRQDLLVDLF